MSAQFEQTWRIRGIPDYPQRLDITLTVGTTAPAVVDVIERAATEAGVVLERVPPLYDQEHGAA